MTLYFSCVFQPIFLLLCKSRNSLESSEPRIRLFFHKHCVSSVHKKIFNESIRNTMKLLLFIDAKYANFVVIIGMK